MAVELGMPRSTRRRPRPGRWPRRQPGQKKKEYIERSQGSHSLQFPLFTGKRPRRKSSTFTRPSRAAPRTRMTRAAPPEASRTTRAASTTGTLAAGTTGRGTPRGPRSRGPCYRGGTTRSTWSPSWERASSSPRTRP